MENKKICPLMSTADKLVECKEDNCAMSFHGFGEPSKCAIVALVESTDYLGKIIDDKNSITVYNTDL